MEKTDMCMRRSGNAVSITCRGIIYCAPVSQVYRIITRKLRFLYVPRRKGKRKYMTGRKKKVDS